MGKKSFYSNKKVLVTGGSGMIGRQLVALLVDKGANVTVVSLDDPKIAPIGVTFVQADLRELAKCLRVCKDKDIVFHLAGIKGSPALTAKQPASFFVPTIMFNTNMMEAARRCGVSRYLYTSTVGVYAPAEVFKEDDVWKSFPSENDRFAGWAKRMGELQAESYKIEYVWDKISIVRPANVYGPFDNFDPETAMVIPSLVARALSGENPLTVWGDGSNIRDFIHAKDVARGMIMAVEKGINVPVNLGSGSGVTIKQLVETIVNLIPTRPIKILWDKSKPKGDRKRLMDNSRAKKLLGFVPIISLEQGIKETVAWYGKNKDLLNKRYNVFYESISNYRDL